MLIQPDAAQRFLAWLIEASFDASVLICAVFVVRAVARTRLSAGWRHALWLLVLLRLMLPWTPESRYSVYNLLPDPVPESLSTSGFGVPLAGEFAPPGHEVAAAPVHQGGAGLIVALWLIGAAGVAFWLIVQALSTVLAFRGRRPVTDRAILDLLEDTKEEIRVRTYLALVETPRVRTPSLFGWIRPRLLLPPGVLGRLHRSQLRHVFLHELAHLKRHDIALNWLMAVLQALHWFNPFVWLAFRHARADRELACDELALSRLEEHESAGYGHTLLDLLTTSAEPRSVPTLAAIGEDGHQIKRRIQMIASFKKLRPASRLLPVAIMLLLGAVFLVNARDGARAPMSAALGTLFAPDAVTSDKPPVDAAIRSAQSVLALGEAGHCGQMWDQFHSVVRGMISRDEFVNICRGQLGAVATECGALVSRRVASVEYVPDLPLGLGPGISVRYASTYEKNCALRGPKLLFAKDTDGVWRLVRGDPE